MFSSPIDPKKLRVIAKIEALTKEQQNIIGLKNSLEKIRHGETKQQNKSLAKKDTPLAKKSLTELTQDVITLKMNLIALKKELIQQMQGEYQCWWTGYMSGILLRNKMDYKNKVLALVDFSSQDETIQRFENLKHVNYHGYGEKLYLDCMNIPLETSEQKKAEMLIPRLHQIHKDGVEIIKKIQDYIHPDLSLNELNQLVEEAEKNINECRLKTTEEVECFFDPFFKKQYDTRVDISKRIAEIEEFKSFSPPSEDAPHQIDRTLAWDIQHEDDIFAITKNSLNQDQKKTADRLIEKGKKLLIALGEKSAAISEFNKQYSKAGRVSDFVRLSIKVEALKNAVDQQQSEPVVLHASSPTMRR